MNSLHYLLIPLAYLLGSFPSAYVAGRLFAGIDITKHGSGNVGGTNALRVLGPGPAVLVAVLDVAKALLPTIWAQHLFAGNTWPTLLVALAAVLGHNYSLFLGGRGGKGIATTIGASMALFLQPLAVVVGIAVVVIALTRYVSLGSLCLVILLPAGLLFFGASAAEVWFSVMLAALGIYRHRTNISRLLSGTENKLGSRKDSAGR